MWGNLTRVMEVIMARKKKNQQLFSLAD